ncbi:phosphodiester glycosidase family protein [Oscillatoria sp. CS-180]|uniref:phosphodiester glycosidase family protein n=1 Tax=Oscillatoria sp. CS-180 TaxID=3021720 RepID=UPI00232B2701|nr:phosphodiester glycosidase family protein [Oscillatoria sp. CS-180]MDB9529050.1 phosphodiester glycosidase family protein [Oscillatoria sp. CS-180]
MGLLGFWQTSNAMVCSVLLTGLTGIGLTVSVSMQSTTVALASQNKQTAQHLVTPIAQSPLASGGMTITLGDKTLPIPWDKRGDRIGVADLPLLHHLGIELQDTSIAAEQPLLWFSETATPVSAWHRNGYRYLDLTDWAAAQGWQLVPIGSSLRIQAPAGKITAGRRGRQTWGDRLVLEVDRPVMWSFVEETTAFTLTIQAEADGAFSSAALMGQNGNVLNTLQVVPRGDQVELRGTFDETARPRVWSLTNPHRIVVDISQVDVVPRDIQWAPGVRWRQEYITVGDRAFPVHQIWLDLSSETQLQPIWSNPVQLPGITPLVTMAANSRAAVAINGGFFNRNNQLPLGAIRSNSQWISGPILNRGAIAWTPEGQSALSPLALSYGLTTAQGETFPVNHINSGYVQAGIGLYTAAWGRTYTPVSDRETLVTVNQNQVVQQTVTGAANTGTYSIPPEGYVLALRSFNSATPSLSPGTTVSLSPDLRPQRFAEFPFAIGGGPILLQNGRINADARAEGFSDAFAAQAAPRSVIATTPNGNMILAAIHYSPGGRGPTLRETAQIMQQLGAQDALNLDGGNSASLYLGGHMINRHRATVGRVHNGLGVFLGPP